MTPTPSQLAAWLKADANKIGYAGAMSAKLGGTAAITQDGTLAALGNAPQASLSAQTGIPLTNLGEFCVQQGLRSKIEDNALNTSSSVRDICLAFRDLIVGMNGPPFDTSDPAKVAFVQSLVTAQVMTSQQQTLLMALGAKSPCSDFEKAFGVGTVISWQQINAALGE